MNPNAKWAPMLWRCGPIEVARMSASKDQKGSAENGLKTAEQWTDPAMLQFLEGSAINCLVLDWAAGGEADAAQQKALLPLIEAGRKKGLSFVGRVTAKGGLAPITVAGKTAGLDAVMLAGPDPGGLALPVIASFARDGVDWKKVTDTFFAERQRMAGSGSSRL